MLGKGWGKRTCETAELELKTSRRLCRLLVRQFLRKKEKSPHDEPVKGYSMMRKKTSSVEEEELEGLASLGRAGI